MMMVHDDGQLYQFRMVMITVELFKPLTYERNPWENVGPFFVGSEGYAALASAVSQAVVGERELHLLSVLTHVLSCRPTYFL